MVCSFQVGGRGNCKGSGLQNTGSDLPVWAGREELHTAKGW